MHTHTVERYDGAVPELSLPVRWQQFSKKGKPEARTMRTSVSPAVSDNFV